MRTPTPVETQVNDMQEDRLRVLVSGAGIAGVAVASVLRANGLHPVVIEKTRPEADPGYMLGLIPLVDRLIDTAGVRDAYMERSVGIHRYNLSGRHGQELRAYSLDDLMLEFGDYRGISREALLDVLTPGGMPVSFESGISGIDQGDTAVVTFSSGTRADFDAVIVAEGIHSSSRDLVIPSGDISRFDSGWGGWVSWMDADEAPDLYEELWGNGFFIGTYPVRNRIGVFVGGARGDTRVGPQAFVNRVRQATPDADARFSKAMDAVLASDDPYYWSFADVRSSSWTADRVVLLGDAAAGFLPTAGVGAGMAMESAIELGMRLVGATSPGVPLALRDYERAQKPRVEAAQENSRQLARLMFHQGQVLALVRDAAMRFVTLKMALGPIRKLLEHAPAA